MQSAIDWVTPWAFSPVACIYYNSGSGTHAGRRRPCKKSLLLLPAFLFHLFSDSIFISVTIFDYAWTLYSSYQPAYSYNLGAGSSWKCTQALHYCRKNKNQKKIVLSVILYLRICSPHAIMETATLLSYDIDLLVHRSYQSMYRTLLES